MSDFDAMDEILREFFGVSYENLDCLDTDMRGHNDGELVALFDEPRWSLGHSFDIEGYGAGEVYIGAR
jgi:hypothetical protein